jgi:hypothetical protein
LYCTYCFEFNILLSVAVPHETPIDKAIFCQKFSDDIIIKISEKIGEVSFIVAIDEPKIHSKFPFIQFHLSWLQKGNVTAEKFDDVWVIGGIERHTTS